jgi:hypothetical protein
MIHATFAAPWNCLSRSLIVSASELPGGSEVGSLAYRAPGGGGGDRMVRLRLVAFDISTN